MELLFEWKQLFGLVLLLLIIIISINFIKRKIKTMKKILLLLFITFTFISCGIDVKPNVTVKNDINLTIDGENIDGIQGEWIISSEEKKEKGKEIIVITIEKNEII
ncbi:hypothetical protein OAM57_00810 [Flavobacteriaceae bacterium]|nr:hypothetical protein [Flavobacteriaceae bacterium]